MTYLHRPCKYCLCTRVDANSDSSGPTIGVRDLRAGLPEAVRRAAGGERTVITSRGRPVAQLAPLDADAPDLARLIGAGAVLPPRRTSTWRAPTAVAVWAGTRIDQVLRELRG